MDLVDDERVPCTNQVILEPPPGNPGGHHHHVPEGGLWGGLPLPIHHPVAKAFSQNRLSNDSGRQGLTGSSPRHDAECLPGFGPLDQGGSVLPGPGGDVPGLAQGR